MVISKTDRALHDVPSVAHSFLDAQQSGSLSRTPDPRLASNHILMVYFLSYRLFTVVSYTNLHPPPLFQPLPISYPPVSGSRGSIPFLFLIMYDFGLFCSRNFVISCF